MELLPQLHRHAETFARQLGCGGFNTSAAETDFLGYLGTVTGHDYPPWGARASWFQYINDMTQQSGTGNPLSPLIVVGSEFNAESDDYYELYFKYAFDLFWQEIFDSNPCPQVVERLYRDFLQLWGGAGKPDKNAGYQHAPFYQVLRSCLQSDPCLQRSTPFVYKHMAYHSERKGSHQWIIVSRLLSFLQHWPVYDCDNADYLSKGEPSEYLAPDFNRETLDDYVFCTESRLGAAAVGGGNSNSLLNGFLEYALDNFQQPRVFLLNPAGKDNIYDSLYNKLFPQVSTVLEWYIPEGRSKKPLRLWRHLNGHYLVFSPMNLTSSVPHNLLADIARLIRKAARKI